MSQRVIRHDYMCVADSALIDYIVVFFFFFFFKQKTAYEIYQCDWSSDVCSSDLLVVRATSIPDFLV